MSITQICRWTNKQFVITDGDLAFYKKIGVPPPTLCPEERRRLRYLFRNERHLYHRTCDLTQKSILSIYRPDSPFVVYDSDIWWSDQWDPLDYGQDFDFNRSFFEQYKELSDAVPRLAIQNIKSENCQYTNYSAENRNCYLIVGSLGSEDCHYSYRIFYSKDVIDCYDLFKCELCYECIQCKQLYNGKYCKNCENSSDLTLCENCTGCQNCFGCINLRNKRYHVFNKAYNKEDYLEKIAELEQDMEATKSKFEDFRLKFPHRATQIQNCENCSGDQLINSRNCHNCFILKESHDCTFICYGSNNKDCFDANHVDDCELQYNAANLQRNHNIIVANLAWYVSDSAYITLCFNSHHLFGCVGMKKNQYCILNKQYTPEKYKELTEQIIEHMKKTGEWGEYFPADHSPFDYKETVAQDHFPLAMNSITQKPFRLTPQEIKLYEKLKVPHPKKDPEQRLIKRQAKVNPHTLHQNTCANCNCQIQTSIAPNRPEKVFCEKCYLSSVY